MDLVQPQTIKNPRAVTWQGGASFQFANQPHVCQNWKLPADTVQTA